MKERTLLQALDYADPEDLGGASRVAFSLGSELAASGWEVGVFAGRKGAPQVSRHRGMTLVHFSSMPSDERTAWHQLAHLWRPAGALRALPKEPPRLLLAHQPFVTWTLRKLAARVPLTYYFHSPWPGEYLARARRTQGRADALQLGVRILIERWALRRARRILVASEFMRRQLALFHPSPGIARKLRKLPYGIDTDRFAPCGDKAALRQQLGLPARATVLLTTRRLEERMGLEELLQAFAICRDRMVDPLLLIVGKGRLEHALKSLTGALGLGATVRFWGYASDAELPSLYSAADVFVLPTQALEGFGLVILEALSAGVPVVATPIGGIPEVLRELAPELLAESARPEAIAERIVSVLRNAAGRADPGRYRRFAVTSYSWKACADGFVRVTGGVGGR